MTDFILGLSFGFHDSSATIVSNQGVIAFAAEERLSRQKHDSSFPSLAIEACLKQANIRYSDLHSIAYHERPEPAFTRVLTSALAGFPRSSREFSAAMRSWLSQKLWVRSEITKRLSGERFIPLDLHPHHDCHAAQSYLTSGYSDSAILTLDAVGEWTSTAIYQGSGSKIENKLSIKFPHSLGLFYSAMTAFLGFVPMDGECSTMALAAFGTPRYADFFRSLITWTHDGYSLDQSYFQLIEFYQEPYTQKLLDVLGPPRSQLDNILFSSLENIEVSADEQRYADIAASVQLVYEESLLHLARLAKRLTGSRNLCLSGGGAMNSVAVKRLVDSKIFASVYVPPDPGDGGAAAGAALLSMAKLGRLANDSHWKPWTGLSIKAEDIDFIEHIRPEHSRRFSKIGLKQEPFEITERRFEDEEVLLSTLAELIANHKILAWCQGSFETGPRALGARSILIRPDNIDLAKRLSQDVKARAAFRPYALSLCEEDASKILKNYDPKLRPYEWMQIVDHVHTDTEPALKAGLHKDGTTRPQVVKAHENRLYHALLLKVRERLGLGALINTSFNESGYPIVHTAREALAIFLRSGMDALVIDKTLYLKNFQNGVTS